MKLEFLEAWSVSFLTSTWGSRELQEMHSHFEVMESYTHEFCRAMGCPNFAKECGEATSGWSYLLSGCCCCWGGFLFWHLVLQTLESLLWKWRPDKGSMRAFSGYIWVSLIWCRMVTIFLRGSLVISESTVVFFYTHQWISGRTCKLKVVRLVILTVDIITIRGTSSSKSDS